jgi:hypothetical protein
MPAACAEAGDADAATLEYQRMRAEGCKVDRHVYSALISAFNEAVRQRRGTAERRADLVLLERAFNLVDDMRVCFIFRLPNEDYGSCGLPICPFAALLFVVSVPSDSQPLHDHGSNF